ncbi:MAG TPA: hypothetical protein VGM29_14525 [Polyangiaceae bacterium]
MSSGARPERQHLARAALALFALLLCTAPTPGDIGGCGQAPDQLDPGVFFATKADLDCRRCQECSLHSSACTRACDNPSSYPSDFPTGCVPLVHDGEVCLRELTYASCADYQDYMSDRSPRVPSECDFCPAEAP